MFIAVPWAWPKMEAFMPIGSNRHLGFTYIGLLMVMAIAGIAMAGVGIVWHQNTQREREKELLFVGEAYRQAIGNYYESSPNGIKQFPTNIEELLLDKRFPTVKRHIRKLYLDPMATGKAWGLLMQQDKTIGVYSQSMVEPIKKTDFLNQYEAFGSASEYREWQFVYTPGTISIPVNPTGGGV